MQERITFAVVELEVLKLYEKGYHLTDNNDIVNHFDFISEFISACGWSPDDYTAHQFGWDKIWN